MFEIILACRVFSEKPVAAVAMGFFLMYNGASGCSLRLSFTQGNRFD